MGLIGPIWDIQIFHVVYHIILTLVILTGIDENNLIEIFCLYKYLTETFFGWWPESLWIVQWPNSSLTKKIVKHKIICIVCINSHSTTNFATHALCFRFNKISWKWSVIFFSFSPLSAYIYKCMYPYLRFFCPWSVHSLRIIFNLYFSCLIISIILFQFLGFWLILWVLCIWVFCVVYID